MHPFDKDWFEHFKCPPGVHHFLANVVNHPIIAITARDHESLVTLLQSRDTSRMGTLWCGMLLNHCPVCAAVMCFPQLARPQRPACSPAPSLLARELRLGRLQLVQQGAVLLHLAQQEVDVVLRLLLRRDLHRLLHLAAGTRNKSSEHSCVARPRAQTLLTQCSSRGAGVISRVRRKFLKRHGSQFCERFNRKHQTRTPSSENTRYLSRSFQGNLLWSTLTT